MTMHATQSSAGQTLPAAASWVSIAEALGALLLDLERALSGLSASTYQDASLDAGFGSTVGKHVRHAIDHVRALQSASDGASACYESRTRGSSLEHDPSLALTELRDLRAFLHGLHRREGAMPISIELAIFRDSPPAVLSSTLERELAFVYGHTIHHMAIIRMLIARSVDAAALPSTFGYAPGTPVATQPPAQIPAQAPARASHTHARQA